MASAKETSHYTKNKIFVHTDDIDSWFYNCDSATILFLMEVITSNGDEMSSELYSKEIQRAKRNLAEGHYEESIRTCGSILEHLIKNIYNEIKTKAEDSVKDLFFEFEKQQEERVNRDDVEKYTLGQMTYSFCYSKLNLFKHVKYYLNIDPIITKTIDFKLYIIIRNKCTHLDSKKDEFVSSLEAKYIFYSTSLIFEEFGYIQEGKCPKCKKPLEINENFCSRCGELINIRCPECKLSNDKNNRHCAHCGIPLYFLKEIDINILENLRKFISICHESQIRCPICMVQSHKEVIDADEEDGIIEGYCLRCGCENKIQNLLKYGCLNINSKQYKDYQYLLYLLSQDDHDFVKEIKLYLHHNIRVNWLQLYNQLVPPPT